MPVVKLPTAHLTINGVAFLVCAERYLEAARHFDVCQAPTGLDPVRYQLFCLSLELHLKAFIWLKDGTGCKEMRAKYGHNLIKLWEDAVARGIGKYARVTNMRAQVIALVSPYYKKRQFCYIDLDMMYGGYTALRENPQIIPTLDRLNERLKRSLKEPVLRAS